MAFNDLIPWGSTGSLFGRNRDPLATLQREMNRMFNDVWGDAQSPRGAMTQNWPSLDMHETDTGWQVSAELPGLDQKDIQLELHDNALTISGEKREQRENKGEGRQYTERVYGRFQRTIPLAGEVDPDKVRATFKDGVLTVDLPKNPNAKDKLRRIPVNADQEQVRH